MDLSAKRPVACQIFQPSNRDLDVDWRVNMTGSTDVPILDLLDMNRYSRRMRSGDDVEVNKSFRILLLVGRLALKQDTRKSL